MGAAAEAIDLATLYPVLAGRLQVIVRRRTRVPEAMIEDACQVAWLRLLRQGGGVRPESALGWLTTTASREAVRQARRQRTEIPLDGELVDLAPARRAPVLTPQEWLDHHERLRALRDLNLRQRRMMWMQAVGCSYAEIALACKCTERTVERQLRYARRKLAS
ncbi:MAG: RNA polymerase sigma factor [Solirubrobacteraceae bacterium]